MARANGDACPAFKVGSSGGSADAGERAYMRPPCPTGEENRRRDPSAGGAHLRAAAERKLADRPRDMKFDRHGSSRRGSVVIK
jgi:hypothetical protein